jgi:hypothetical protein
MKLVYVHIPKTGGNTVASLLRGAFGKSHKIFRESHDMHNDHNVMSAVGDEKYPVKHIYKPWKDQRYEDADIIMGHFKKTKYLHTGYPMITWLRDPVERVISNYQQQTTKWPKARSKAPTYYKMVSDHTLRTYARVWDQMQWWYCDGSIDDFLFVGICERFDESIEGLGKVLGVKFPKEIPRANPTKDKMRVSGKVKKEIAKYMEKDYIIYNKALERFDGKG